MKLISDTAAEKIILLLQSSGHEAYYVGGAVRDALSGDKPKDIDITTSARPDTVIAIFNKPKNRKVFRKSVRIIDAHSRFGTVTLVIGKKEYEITTFRKDISEGRHPEVEFSDIFDDASRRDLTINALYYDPLTDTVKDPLGTGLAAKGQFPKLRRVIESIGDPRERFREDPLRILRVARFAARYPFPVDPNTLKAMSVLSESIKSLSKERIKDELTKLLMINKPSIGFNILQQSGTLKYILPEVSKLQDVPQNPEHHPEGDAYIHTMLAVDSIEKNTILKWSALLHDTGKLPSAKTISGIIRFPNHESASAKIAYNVCRRLKMTNKDTKAIVYIVKEHMILHHWKSLSKREKCEKLASQYFHFIQPMVLADTIASQQDTSKVIQYFEKMRSECDSERVLQAGNFTLIQGRDIVGKFEDKREMGKIIKSLRSAYLSGVFNTKRQGLELLNLVSLNEKENNISKRINQITARLKKKPKTWKSTRSDIITKEIKLPFSTKVLLDFGIKGRTIGEYLNKARKYYASSKFKATKDEIINHLITVSTEQ